jgi:AraC-like DNA-binding protein
VPAYRERPSVLPGAFVWTRRLLADAPTGTLRILPDGCIDLLYFDGSLQVAGPDRVASLVPVVGGRSYAAVRLPPGLGGRILGLPAAEIRDERPSLDQIWPKNLVRSWQRTIAGAGDPAAALERLVLARSQEVGLDRWPRLVTAMFRSGSDVRSVAAELGWGERLLHRRSLVAFGYAPQLLRRILRFSRAVSLARTTRTLAEVAATCGYTDQAHLAKEARTLAGVPMGQLT